MCWFKVIRRLDAHQNTSLSLSAHQNLSKKYSLVFTRQKTERTDLKLWGLLTPNKSLSYLHVKSLRLSRASSLRTDTTLLPVQSKRVLRDLTLSSYACKPEVPTRSGGPTSSPHRRPLPAAPFSRGGYNSGLRRASVCAAQASDVPGVV